MSNTSPTGSQLVYEYQPLTPAGTVSSAPNKVDLPVPQYELQLVQWVVPPGPQGNLGWQLWYSDALVIPQNGGWIITDNERNTWELDDMPTGGDWTFVGYNTGSYDHTVYLRFLMNPLSSGAAPSDLGLISPQDFPPVGTPVAGDLLYLVGDIPITVPVQVQPAPSE